MNFKYLIVTLLACVGSSLFTYAHAADQQTYENETAIVFKANDGQTSDAYEGFIWVPENRNNPDSRLIKISYVRFPSKAQNKGSPIIYLAGGPGGSGIATAKWRRFPLFVGLTEHADVIALDQRGTGQSNNLPKCTSSQSIDLTKVTDIANTSSRYRNAALECHQFWQQQGIDVLGYTSVQNALDLDDLRKHFKAQKVSLWGISYGSHLAFAAMSLFEDRIDKVVIASAEGLNQTVKLPSYTSHYFARVQAQINGDEKLKSKFPDIQMLMSKVHKTLLQNPIALKIPTRDGKEIDFLFQKHHMQLLASMMIADPNQYLAMLLQTYAELAEGKTDVLSKILSRGIFNNTVIDFKLMSFAMDVASGITDSRLAQVKRETKNGLLGDLLNFPMPHLNKVIPELDLGDTFRLPKPNAVPTLLFTGTLDGRTYVEGQKESVAHLKQLTQVIVENAGHNLYTISPEVLARMLAFFADQQVDTKPIVVEPAFIKHLQN